MLFHWTLELKNNNNIPTSKMVVLHWLNLKMNHGGRQGVTEFTKSSLKVVCFFFCTSLCWKRAGEKWSWMNQDGRNWTEFLAVHEICKIPTWPVLGCISTRGGNVLGDSACGWFWDKNKQNKNSCSGEISKVSPCSTVSLTQFPCYFSFFC